MSKLLTAVLAAVFAVVTVSPVAFAQDQKKDQKKAQVDKGTPAQGTVQKKDQTKAKTDTKKKTTTTKKKAEPKKAEEKK
jgi:pentapeptide MXKDX repeat protein